MVLFVGVSVCLEKYINTVRPMSEKTATLYYYRLRGFDQFLIEKYQQNLDEVITKLARGELNAYDILAGFVSYLQKKELDSNSVRAFVNTAKVFFEYNDIDVNPRKYKIKVKLPKGIRRHKEAISKDDARNIILACTDIKLRTYVMFLAATGMRAQEALNLRNKHFDFQSDPCLVKIPGQFTKTKTDRSVFLTDELSKQCRAWLDFKYRERRIIRVKDNGKAEQLYYKPEYDENDTFFAVRSGVMKPRSLYANFGAGFAQTIDAMGKGQREENYEKRRKITLHSFRRLVKTTISNLGYGDFSEWFIGHSGSTYWRETEQKKNEIFRKIEQYLTFLDVSSLEAKRSDIESRIEQKDSQLKMMQQQMALIISYMTETDQKVKSEISRKLLDIGYMPKLQ